MWNHKNQPIGTAAFWTRQNIFRCLAVFLCLAACLEGTALAQKNVVLAYEAERGVEDTSDAESTYDTLYEIIKSLEIRERQEGPSWLPDEPEPLQQEESPAESLPQEGNVSSNSGLPDTTVQVDGVKEADCVKTDGEYLYLLSNGKLVMIRANGAASQPVSTADLCEAGEGRLAYPYDFYLWGDRLVVLRYVAEEAKPEAHPEPRRPKRYDRRISYTEAAVYDISNKEAPVCIKRLGQSGDYLTSRMVNGTLYLVTNYYLPPHALREKTETYVPSLYNNGKESVMEAADLVLSQQADSRQYVVITAAEVQDEGSFTSAKAVFGGGSAVYADGSHLLLSAPRYLEDETGESVDGLAKIACYYQTDLILFDLEEGEVRLRAEGSLPGMVQNQFSLDIWEGHIRAVTTISYQYRLQSEDAEYWSAPWMENDSQRSALYVLDDMLNPVGCVEDLAPGEWVSAVRFAGDQAYFTTQRQVDPLFSLNLSDPENPHVAQTVEIPEFYDYLHHYSDRLLLGLGRSAEKDGWLGGLQLTLFDISTPDQIRQTAVLELDETYSVALYDHKAIYVAPDLGLIGFPADGKDGCSYCLCRYSAEDGLRLFARWENEYGSYQARGFCLDNCFYLCAPEGVQVYDMTGKGTRLASISLDRG